MRKVIKWMVIAVATAAVIVVATGFYMLDYALAPLHRERGEAIERLAAREPADVVSWVDSVTACGALCDTTVERFAESRYALWLRADVPTANTAVLVHGYQDCNISMLHLAYMYHKQLGYNVLLPDLAAHGKSRGSHIGMGWRDAADVIAWTEVARQMFGDSCRIVLHGISMGAATVMNAGGSDRLPTAVVAIVEDCGYTSVWDEFAVELKAEYSLPEFPVLYASNALCRLRYGWDFKEASPLESVGRCRVPMLFVHGGDDTFVPTAMVYRLYAAHGGKKELLVVKGAGHAESYTTDPQLYTATVARFLLEASACGAVH